MFQHADELIVKLLHGLRACLLDDTSAGGPSSCASTSKLEQMLAAVPRGVQGYCSTEAMNDSISQILTQENRSVRTEAVLLERQSCGIFAIVEVGRVGRWG